MSLTDHDTVKGVPEATEAGERMHMEVVPGTELSAHIRDREVHILAYCIDYQDDQLGTTLAQVFSIPLPAGDCHRQRRSTAWG